MIFIDHHTEAEYTNAVMTFAKCLRNSLANGQEAIDGCMAAINPVSQNRESAWQEGGVHVWTALLSVGVFTMLRRHSPRVG
jgi:hypothetical protein